METTTLAEGVGSVTTMAQSISDLGFLVVFASVVLVLMIIFFIVFLRQTSKKNESDTSILKTEREAAIKQNEQMYHLVTEVQTNQIAQLQEIGQVLQSLTSSVDETRLTSLTVSRNVDKMGLSLSHLESGQEYITKLLGAINESVKENDLRNKEIMETVRVLETMLKSVHKQYISSLTMSANMEDQEDLESQITSLQTEENTKTVKTETTINETKATKPKTKTRTKKSISK